MVWNDELEGEQLLAASHHGSHARLLSGPGTGKTHCLTRRILFLIEEQDVDPEAIYVLTFTRSAAAELRQRIESELDDETPLPHISTLHSFSLKMLLRNPARTKLPDPIRVADDFEERNIIMEELKSILNLNIRQIQDLFNQMSADWERLTVHNKRFPNPEFLGAWYEHRSIYRYTLRAELVYQLKLALEQGEEFDFGNSIDYLLVDEYQDLNPCDLATIQQLTASGAELYCAGDDDQSIYGFRYADPEGIRRFLDNYKASTGLVLESCRRCDENILNFAMYVAKQDPRRINKKLTCCTAGKGKGNVHLLWFRGQRQEADGIADICNWLINTQNVPADKILILLRSDRHRIFSNVIRDSLSARGIHAKTYSNPMKSLDCDEGRHFLCLLYLLNNREDHLAWRSLLKIRDNNVGDATFRDIYELARNHSWTYSQSLQQIVNNPNLIKRGTFVQIDLIGVTRILDAINIDDIKDYSEFIEQFANDHIHDEQLRDEIVNLFQNIIQQTESASLDWILRSINVSLRDNEQDQSETNSVSIMTMHQAKGLTADAVFIAACEDEYIPGRQQIDDERRLLYVSLTRARHYLFATYSTMRTGIQKHSGRTSGNSRRTLTRLLRGGPIHPENGTEHINDVINQN